MKKVLSKILTGAILWSSVVSSLSAGVLSYDNFGRDGVPVLIPAVQVAGPEWTCASFPAFSRWSRLKKHPEYIKKRRLSYFFRKIDRPVEIYVDYFGDNTVNCTALPLWKEGRELEPY